MATWAIVSSAGKGREPSNCLTKLVIPLGMPNDDIDGITLGSDFMHRWALQ